MHGRQTGAPCHCLNSFLQGEAYFCTPIVLSMMTATAAEFIGEIKHSLCEGLAFRALKNSTVFVVSDMSQRFLLIKQMTNTKKSIHFSKICCRNLKHSIYFQDKKNVDLDSPFFFLDETYKTCSDCSEAYVAEFTFVLLLWKRNMRENKFQ